MPRICQTVKTTRKRLSFNFFALLTCGLLATGASAAEKRIRLRNETIVTQPATPAALRSLSAEPAQGLYLVQLTDNIPADWRDQLAALRVKTLRAVPDDAFVAELDNANLVQIRSLPFIQWVGQYRPEHKTHPLVAQISRMAEEQRVRVTALLSPAANGLDTAILQRVFRVLTRYSKSGAGKVLEGEISSRKISQLMNSPAVLWIEPAPEMKLFDAVAAQIVAGEAADQRTYTLELGFDGEGVTVAVADSGLDFGDAASMHPDLFGRVDGFFYYGNLLDASDEHSHGTHVTGIIAGDGASGETDENGFLYGLGIAPEAHIVAQRIFDGLGGYEPPESMAQLTTDAVRSGAVIGSNSWGDDTQGRYDISAMEFDALVRDADPETPGDQPYILEFSAGNAGPGDRTIGSPAVAKNVIASGASQNNRFDFFIYADGQESMADFSSRGPAEDGRIKPDVTAPGTWIASLQSSAATDENAWAGISPLYQYQGGTSQSGPQVSGAAAVFVQYYRETHNGQTPSPALVKAALINSAVDMDNSVTPLSGGTSYTPNMDEGWGRVDLTELIGSERSFDFTDQTSLLATGQVFEKRLVLASSDQPLKVTLAYTDVPGFPPAIPALVNDLDLEVVSPSGILFRGNQFLDGESVPDNGASDSVNNVEGVHLEFPEAGEYLVRVIGRKVIQDARRDSTAIDQDFALVFSGDVPMPGEGVLALDRRAYTVPSLVNLKLIDFDLAGQSSAQVSLSVPNHPSPLAVTLLPSGPGGVFTGVVETASMPFAADGRLHLAHGDSIEAEYVDASPANTVHALARADLIAPVISNVTATNRFGKELVNWRTDEPSRSVLYYSSNAVTFASVTNSIFSQNPEVLIADLAEGVTYQFYIVAADAAGNLATNNNNGSYFSFVPMPASTVLLVDAYVHSPDAESIEIPVSSYTSALDRTGISYEVWDVETEGSPTVADLSPFRVVMWRVNDSFWSADNTITVAQQAVITNYLGRGGAFFLASMDILTRVGDSPFRTNVLQVSEFVQHVDAFDECPECHEDQGASAIHGPELEPLTSGVDLALDYSQYPVFELEPIFPNIGPDLSDTFVPTTNAAPVFLQQDDGIVGIKYPRTGQDTDGRVVFLSFPLDAVPLDGPSPNNRADLLRSLLSFLAPGLNGLGTIALDNTAYTVPSRVTIEVADSDLLEQESIQVQCRVAGRAESTTVELKPTVRPGLFRGFLTLVPTNEPAGAERLRVTHGDRIFAEYMDRSAQDTVQAGAIIDSIVPEIQNVDVEPDYELAIVSWETSKPTDALIQFGESTFLGKTAYQPGLSTSHELIVPTLLPDKLYYYQVVSRDAAGNTVIDDNNGQLYTFRTLKPLLPPWFDNLETGATEWSVQDGEESESSWQLGVPNNSLATQAHSPQNAWGSNLKGDSPTYVQTFLVSPAIELTGGNTATLKFWHNYDFLGDATFEMGRLLLFTNVQTQPITLANYEELTFDWEQEEMDLTPYLGKVVHLVWAYEMLDFSFENNTFPGWLLDDVEVIVTNVVRGTIQVTNNLAAATFSVSGPTSFEGAGRSLVRSNAIGGDYVIQFGAVPYYHTPPPQTNTLSGGATLVLAGQYTFDDANSNGMADAWEQEHFDEVSNARTAATDTDGDGLSDLGEFVSGTDPTDRESRLQMLAAEVLSANRIRLTWPSVEGKTYRVLGSVDGTVWELFGTGVRANAYETSYTLVTPTGSRAYFFKVELLP